MPEEKDPQAYIRLTIVLSKDIYDGKRKTGIPLTITNLSRESGHPLQTVSKVLRSLADEGRLGGYPGTGHHAATSSGDRR